MRRVRTGHKDSRQHKIGTGVAQQSFDLLDRSPNYTARLAGLNLALQLEEAPIGAVEALRQDRCNVKERDRVYQRPLLRASPFGLSGRAPTAFAAAIAIFEPAT